MEVIEKRDYYRLEDTISTEFRVVTEADVRQYEAATFFELPRGFALLRDLHLLNLEAAELVRDLAAQNLNLGAFLGNLNKRIELLTRTILDVTEDDAADTAILSEGGITLPSSQLLDPGTYVALKMLFKPTCLGMTVYAAVKHARMTDADGVYSLGVQFLDMSSGDEQLIARHILRQQTQRRREQIRNEKFE